MSRLYVHRHLDTSRDEVERGKTYSMPTNNINKRQTGCNIKLITPVFTKQKNLICAEKILFGES